ncbi:hypothetical protein JCM3775_005204 [Rhodotorula graminis]
MDDGRARRRPADPPPALSFVLQAPPADGAPLARRPASPAASVHLPSPSPSRSTSAKRAPSSARRASSENHRHAPGETARDERDGANDGDGGDAAEESLADWMARYRVGMAGPSDETPVPPPAIRAILEGRDNLSPSASSGRESPLSLGSVESPRSSVSSLPSINSLTAASLLDFYRRKGHFPAPPGPYEEERLRLAHKYGLDQPVRRKAIDRICALAKAYFRTQSVVISLTFDDHQVLGAERGWGGDEPGLDVPPRPLTMEPAFCTHAMAASYRDPKAVFIVGDADQDWRFKKNPYTIGNGGGLAFYAAANVSLPVAPSSRKTVDGLTLPASLASGALCLIDPIPRAPSDFAPEDRVILGDFAEMISREFQLGFEQRRREQEAKQSEFIDSFLRKALVLPSQGEALRPPEPSVSPPSTPTGAPTPAADAPSTPPAASTSSPETLFQLAARHLRILTNAGSAAILDLRALRTSSVHTSLHHPQQQHARHYFSSSSTKPAPSSPRRDTFNHGPAGMPTSESLGSHFWRVAGETSMNGAALPTSPTSPQSPRSPSGPTSSIGGRSTTGPLPGRVALMGAEGDVEWLRVFEEARTSRREGALAQATEEVLQACQEEMASSPENSFVDAEPFAAASFLPPTLASSSACIPVFDTDGSPIVLIVLTSGEKWFSFEPTDRRFAGSVGAIVVGSLLRQRALEADMAKLRFVSHVSHELRTPLHGCNSQIELIREFASPDELRKLAPLLDTADVCLESLSDVLNDTLDFSKLSQSLSTSPEEQAEYRRRAFVVSDLGALVEGVTKSTWVRKQRVDAVTADLAKLVEGEKKVDLVLELEERAGGWQAMIDVGGLKRVLLNLVGNALKFTVAGEVKISLKEVGILPAPAPSTPGALLPLERRLVSITVRDTGIGMSDDFIRARRYLIPFIQADPFSSGAGLGLSIVDSIVKRMGGKLDVASQLGLGTAITVTLPLDFTIHPSSPLVPPSLPRIVRRNISEELSRLLRPRPHEPTPQSSTSTSAQTAPLAPGRQRSTTLSSRSGDIAVPAGLSKAASPIEELSFDEAVSAMHASLESPHPSPSSAPGDAKRTRRPSMRRLDEPHRQVSARAVEDDLAVEAAKLSLSGVGDKARIVTPMKDPLLPSPPLEEPPSPGFRRRKVRVLIAEDNPIARNILVKLLTGKNIAFSAAEDGQEALDLFLAGEGTFTLFLCDVQMPRMDGIEASTQVRRVEAERGWEPLRIIALTGLSNDAEMQAALGQNGPVDEWVVKGGRSLRIILEEVATMQRLLDEAEAEGASPRV